MDTISSAEFRKTYAKLKAPTTVTVNGHPIGTWLPNGEWTVEEGDWRVQATHMNAIAGPQTATPRGTQPSFNTRPFTPVPKHR